jgi:hypothetical protein
MMMDAAMRLRTRHCANKDRKQKGRDYAGARQRTVRGWDKHHLS